MKQTIYITGHKNPDLDSLCSAYAYAALKNRIDPEKEYRAVRCGQMSESVEKQLQLVGVEAPPYMADVFPKVSDVMLRAAGGIDVTEPVYQLVKRYNKENPSVTPLFENGVYAGLLSIDDVTAWFLKENTDDNPKYDFTVKNIAEVLPGQILHQGSRDSFVAPITVGAASIQDFSEFIPKNADSLVVMGARPEHIRYAIRQNVPAIIITTITLEKDADKPENVLPAIHRSGPEGIGDKLMPEIDVSGYDGLIYITSLSTAETIRRLRMSEPLGKLMGSGEENVQASDLFADAKDLLASSSARGLAVMENETFVGYVTRRCFLDRPAYNVILVDHNEAGQSIKGIETANIVEIIDHHRLDAMKTDLPILVDARPLGSTCTIVWQQYLANGITPDIDSAKMLLTGVLSDTLILKSPTTTGIDRKTVQELSAICGVDYQEFGEMLYSVTSNLATRDPEEAIKSDFKVYESNDVKVGIGQCETTTLKNIDEYAQAYLAALETVKNGAGLDWAMLMVTNVLSEKSILLTTIHRDGAKLPYEKIIRYNDPEAAGSKAYRAFDMPGVMSRKKQLLPAVLRAIEE
ncbi:MAG: DHH family phosphoesterase [Parasporobacterium sp.]|nr:DHH family phosphoesterase [Parasporobacterium sp.]